MHDYQISWDYMLDDYIERKHILLINRICKQIKRNILYKLEVINNFEVYPIILPGELLGVYCKGTSSKPVIGIDVGNILIACEKYNVSFNIAIKTTILHELKHAQQDYNNISLNEFDAEEFAFNNS